MRCSLVEPSPAAMAAWQELAGRALAPSGFNAPEILIPALRGTDARLATVTDADGLQLALPLKVIRRPLRVFSNLSTPFSDFAMPHLGQRAAAPAIEALLSELNAPLLLRSVPVGGGVWSLIGALPARRAVLARWQRAMVAPHGRYEAWYEATVSAGRRKEYRRLFSRLAERGAVEFTQLSAGGDASAWARQFLALEASGWKGRRGTALAGDPAVAARFAEGLAGLAESGKLRAWQLSLDGAPLAMLFAVVEGRHAWLGKTAYDEGWARNSPGTLLILRATEDFFAERMAQVDSCAIPGHPQIDRLWPQRLPMADVMLAAPETGRRIFAATVAQERIRRASRHLLRDAVHGLTGRRRS